MAKQHPQFDALASSRLAAEAIERIRSGVNQLVSVIDRGELKVRFTDTAILAADVRDLIEEYDAYDPIDREVAAAAKDPNAGGRKIGNRLPGGRRTK